MYDLPDRTLLEYLDNPLFQKVNMGATPCARFSRDMAAFAASTPGGTSAPAPEQDALSFYFLNHAFHLIKARHNALERLDEDMDFVARLHLVSTTTVAKRLLYYCLMASINESFRTGEQRPDFWAHMLGSFGPEFVAMIQKPGHAFWGKLPAYDHIPLPMGQFCTALMSTFAFGRWNPGAGGPGFASIMALALDTITGVASLEQFADQAFSLEHNNGSMFDRGVLYQTYTASLHPILDVQDAGQIPQLINMLLQGKGVPNTGATYNHHRWHPGRPANEKAFVTTDVARAYRIMSQHFPNEMGGPMDMDLVKTSAAKRAKAAAQQHARWQIAMANRNNAAAASAAPALTSAQQRALNNTTGATLGIDPGKVVIRAP